MKRNGFLLMILLTVLATLLAACGKDKYEPKAVNPEIDRCTTCNMAVNDDPFATQVITKEGQSLKFDDIGCMYEWFKENGKDTVGAAYVRDYHTKDWVLYEKAYYVYDASFQTPMAYGIVSFKSESEARKFAEEQGKGQLMTASELDSHTWERNREMMEKMKEQHMGGMDGMNGMHGQEQAHAADDGHGQDESGGHDGQTDQGPAHPE